jgi:excisionase family DNA binding protein
MRALPGKLADNDFPAPARTMKRNFDTLLREPVAPVVFTVAQAAKELGCADNKIVELIDEGKLPAIDIAGSGSSRRCLRIPIIEARKAFSKLRATRPTSQTPCRQKK